jgi:hypothetical protein
MRYSTLLLLVALTPAAARAQVIDFEDLTVPAAGYYNGSDGAGGFTSRGARFNNSYSGGFASGWSYSRITDTTTPGFTNQYSAYNLPAGGGDSSPTYGIVSNFNYSGPAVADTSVGLITLPPGTRPAAMRVTNTTYAALSMKNGDSFAKKFGGPTGNDPDFFLLTVQGRDGLGALTGAVDFYLADYRFADNSQDYIVSTWTTVNLSSLPATTSELTFRLTSLDVGMFGINTPAYFALDNLSVTPVPEPAAWLLTGLGAAGVTWARRKTRPGPTGGG